MLRDSTTKLRCAALYPHNVREDCERAGLTLTQAVREAHNRVKWRSIWSCLCVLQHRQDIKSISSCTYGINSDLSGVN